MPSVPTRLSIVVPGFATECRRRPVRMPALERLVAYGRTVRKTRPCNTHEDWQVELLEALELAPASQYSSAPLSWIGGGGKGALGPTVQNSIFHVDPIRMEMSSDGLTLGVAEPWSHERLNDLKRDFADHLGSADASLEIAGQRLFVNMARAAVVETTCAQQAERVSLRDALPRGPAAADIRRLMTEIQMLMHDKYSEAGAANGVWLWGNGVLAPPQLRPLPILWTNDEYSRGLYELHQAKSNCELLPQSFPVENELPAHSIVVVRGLSLEAIETHWMEPALAVLHSGRLDQVDLWLDGFGVHARRSAWQRLFARPRGLEELLQ